MIEVTEADRERAEALWLLMQRQGPIIGAEGGRAIGRGFLEAFAAHRQQAEDAMRERCAKVADVYSQVNFETAGDSVLLDPVLRGKGFSPANVAASEKHQIDGLVHSSYAHAGQHLAAAIRGIDAGGEG